MTKEEAKIILNNVKKEYVAEISDPYVRDIYRTMFDIALKSLSAEPCEDAVSRKAAIEIARSNIHYGLDKEYEYSRESLEKTMAEINSLPSVRPQEPKMGHWKAKSFHELYCNNCGFNFDIMRNDFIDKMKFCPNCGAKMESEDKE